MATVLWLADALRAAGLATIEHPGWRNRAAAGTWNPVCGIVHATAAPTTQSDVDQVRIVRDGRAGLSGPIANACVDRAGVWHVLASGRCNTTLAGTAGPYAGVGNGGCLGVEACNDNRGEPWPAVQYESYAAGWAVIARRMGWAPANLRGHREHTPGHKSDPTFDMNVFRGRVAHYMQGGVMPVLTTEDTSYQALTWREHCQAFGDSVVPNGPDKGKVHWQVATLKALTTAVAKLGGEVAESLRADLDEIDANVAAARAELGTAIAGVDEAVIEALTSRTPEDIADALRVSLGEGLAMQVGEHLRRADGSERG